MIIKIKKYIAKVDEYVEDEAGNISKIRRDIEIKRKRVTDAGVLACIPRTCKLVEHGVVYAEYDIPDSLLESLGSVFAYPCEETFKNHVNELYGHFSAK